MSSPIDMEGTITLTDRASATIAKVQRNLQGFAARSGLSRIASEFGKTGKAVANLGTVAGRALRPVAMLAGALGIGTAAGLAGGVAAAVRTWGEAGDELAKFGRQVGIAAGELQEMYYVAGKLGVTQDKMTDSLREMSKRIGEAKQGQGSLKGYLEKANPALLKQVTAAKDASEAFGLLLGAANAIRDPMQRAAFLAQAFGDAGVPLARMAEAGGDQIGKLRDRFKELYGQRTPEDFANAEAWTAGWGDLVTAVTGLGHAIGAVLLPELTPVVKEMTDWIAANREWIALSIKDAIIEIRDALKDIDFKQLLRDIGDFVKNIGKAVKFIGGFKTVALALAAVLAAPVVNALLGVAVAFSKLGAAILASPIGLAIAGIAAGAYLIWKNWDRLGPEFEQLWGGIKDTFGGFGDFVKGTFTGDLDGAIKGLGRMFGGLGDIWGAEFDILTGLFSGFLGEIDGILGTDLKGIFDEAVASFKAFFADPIGSTLDWLSKKFEGLKNAVKGWGSNWQENMTNPSAPSMGAMANGGRFGAGKWALVGEKGPEIVKFDRPGEVFSNDRSRQMLAGGDLGGFAGRIGRALGGGGSPEAGGRTDARLEIAFRNAPAGTSANYRETGSGLFSDVKLDTGPSMRPAFA